MIFVCDLEVLEDRRLAQFQLRIAVVGFVQPEKFLDGKDLAVIFGGNCRHSAEIRAADPSDLPASQTA